MKETYGSDLINISESQDGLTKREYFAAMAMQGLCGNAFDKQIQTQAEEIGSNSSEAIAVYAVDIADELIKALNAKQ